MLNENSKIKVGILRGGEGEHYASSIKKGGEIISHIFENLSDKYKPVDILIDKEGVWYLNGIPTKPADLIRKVDVVWNTSKHPNLSLILDDLSIPNIGDGSFLKSLENNNDMLRTYMKSIQVPMPRTYIIKKALGRSPMGEAKEVFEKFSSPWIVKTFTPDSNMAIHLAKTFPELVDAIEDGVKHEKSILVEEFIDGKIGSVHSVSFFRGQDIYIFPPRDFISSEKEKIIDLVKNIHKHLGVRHYLKSDFIFHPKKGFFLTGIDFLPDLRKGSHFEQSCEFVGAKMHHIIEHILDRAR